jgi:leukotriene A-4 hydrolase/aminopeptidase
VDFDEEKLKGSATWSIKTSASAKKIMFDINGLIIQDVFDQAGSKLKYQKIKRNDYLGEALEVMINPGTTRISIAYETGNNSYALQWVKPQQTSGKKFPFLYTQSQSIAARTWLPCQDSPGIRFTYDAVIQVPKELMAVMSAVNPTVKNPNGLYAFMMKQSIPSYLMALAVGDFRFQTIGKRTGVYAEPIVLEKAVYEFADMEKMLETAEKLFGPYRWQRYDILVLPPSFPFGGMENPRITFATPTVLAGDRSLVSLVAHEMAHSWSGNLVTNATWNDFWLNEGFTVFLERRIDEELYGKSFVDMEAYLGLRDLKESIAEMGTANADSKLKLNLDNRNPEDAMSDIAYEKGYNFLKVLQQRIGKEAFDAFLKKYFTDNAFTSMTTENFILYMNKYLIDPNINTYSGMNVNDWVYEPGLPNNCLPVIAERFNQVDAAVAQLLKGTPVSSLDTKTWSTHEWIHFINRLDTTALAKKLAEVDDAYKLTLSTNCEIQAAWYLLAAKYEYKNAYTEMEKFLLNVGRRKYLRPIYKQLVQTKYGQELALSIYKKAKENYHQVSQRAVEEILKPYMN